MNLIRREDVEVVIRDMAGVFQLLAYIMLIPIVVSILYGGDAGILEIIVKIVAFIIPGFIFHLTAAAIRKNFKSQRHTEAKHALLSMVFIWLIVALVGALPFMIRGTLGPVDAFFESMSGWATTGMTQIEYPEYLMDSGDYDILFYRSLTHLVGGVGIIALALMVLMQSKTAAKAYYGSEVGSQKIRPAIKGTLKETWKIYGIFTFTCAVLLYLAGMTPFDAVNHSFSALSTGGFSTHSQSIAYFNSPLIEGILIFFMIVGAVSFLLHYRLLNGDIKGFFGNIETRYMFILILFSVAIITPSLYNQGAGFQHVDLLNGWESFRLSVFQTVSAITCTGFSTANAGDWPEVTQTIIMGLMYTGGMYGSTAGGIKLLRLAIIIRAVFYVTKRMLLPRSAVVVMKVDQKPIDAEDILYVLGFGMIYLVIAVIGALFFMLLGYTGYHSMALTLSAMGNVGIVYITGDPWYHMPAIGKIVVALLMWVGRLEIFPMLMLLQPIYEKSKDWK
ncbi:MAG: TrkH family potassium uptake protein [Candidatus Altiarchaeota archaeon]